MSNDVIIEVRGLEKEFPGVRALKGVDFDIKRGTVHCVVGENGAGKSTFIKILTGAHRRTGGSLKFNGNDFDPKSIREAMNAGISVLYQELNVVDDLTTEENLTLGKEKSKFGFIQKSDGLGKMMDIIRSLDDSIELDMPVDILSVAQKQVIEIAKALSTDCSVLVMDEPTASLSEDEVRRLFLTVKKLKEQGITIIFISHKLSEIFEIGDYVTVFRDGEMTGTKSVPEIAGYEDALGCPDTFDDKTITDACTELVRLMIGKVIDQAYIASESDYSQKLLEVKNVSNHRLHDINFDLYKGEILGFYGLVGAGKTEVGRFLYGIDNYEGDIFVNGEKCDYKNVIGALEQGFAMVPEERRVDGIFGQLPIRANIPMMRMDSVLSSGLISRIKENKLADKFMKMMSVAAKDREQAVAFLSGGNQQKVVIAKCLNRDADIIMLDEPTRGVDVGAKEEIHDIIRGLANEGKSIIVFSSELPEITHLCDRIVLMYDGSIGEIVKNKKDIDIDHIMNIVAGG
ncbi:MAG: sugar ABC transporter ATP-binding protein [Spirochaetales bacterium]|nr:sugar ABC transporter ATP-binding protein [Spirochaetales bacterium]